MDTKSGGNGKIDFQECLKNRIAKNVSVDKNLIISMRKIAQLKIESADLLPPHLSVGKISLLYDALREYLECISIKNGYKIYNHECYTPFLKEILKMPKDAENFDKIRKIRNGINYYGREIDVNESEHIIKELQMLIKKFKQF
jgi:hypothetical protein